MTQTYLALLRGINVGGNSIVKMDKLKASFEKLKFAGVKTYIQSGNVLFDAEEESQIMLSKQIESQLLREFGIETKTALLSRSELAGVVDNKPDNFGSDSENYKYDVIFTIAPVTASDVQKELKLKEGVDTMSAGENAVYITRLKKELTKSRFSKITQAAVYPYITIRNWNTVQKLYAMIKERNNR
jgi:uncharacterized protein (DUF1697 family)